MKPFSRRSRLLYRDDYLTVWSRPQGSSFSRARSQALLLQSGYLQLGEHGLWLLAGKPVMAQHLHVTLNQPEPLPPLQCAHPCQACVRCINHCPAKVLGHGLKGRRSLKCHFFRIVLGCHQCFDVCVSRNGGC